MESIYKFLMLRSICSVLVSSYFDIRFGVLMIKFRYLIILNLFVNNFICLYFNYMLIMFFLFRIAGSIMKFVSAPILMTSVIWMIPLYLETN